MPFNGSGKEALRHMVAKAIWEKRPDCRGKVWPLSTEEAIRAYPHNPIASVDLSFIYADAAIGVILKRTVQSNCGVNNDNPTQEV